MNYTRNTINNKMATTCNTPTPTPIPISRRINNYQLTFSNTKIQTPTKTTSSLLSFQHCSFLILLTLSLISFANCDDLLAATFTPHTAVGPPGPTYINRLTRNNNYVNDFASMTAAITPNKEDKNRHEHHLAAFGLRTRHKPQQFYKAWRNLPAVPVAAIKAVTITAEGLNDFASHSDLASLNQVAGAREDICKTHCTCAKVKNAFTAITCDFQENRDLSAIFGTNFKVPEDSTSITIKLSSNTNFRLERDFFNNNKVNSFTIEGTYSDREQVELATEAFRGNHGPYPEIYMLNVFSVVVRARTFSGNCKFSVRNSNDLILFPDAFQNASINGLFVGINDLRIEEKAFNSAQAKLRIESSHIDNIYRFEASLREIRFVNCTIGTINGGTFDVITINSIVFESCRIDVIKARAITEKLYSEHVSITGAIIGTIESEAIYGSGIAELILTRNKIDLIQENAIHVTAINATITHNNIKHLGNNWLRVKEWSNIVVAKNQFGVFGRMLLEETKQPVTCRFESNSLTKPLIGSLNITNRYCVLREISVNIPCKCHLGWLHELSVRDLRSETYCTIDDKLSFCFNASSFNTLKYLNEVCDETKTTLDCVKNMNLKKIDGVFFTPEELERRDHRIPKLIFIVAGAVTLLILAVIAVITAYRCCSRSSKSGSSGQFSNSTAIPQISDHLHEFTQADRAVIEQTLVIMQKKYPNIQKQVNNRIQILMQPDLSDKKCVKMISNIIDMLNQVEHPGDDFMVFNRVLTQHLQPVMPSAPPVDPIYAEPGQAGVEGLDDGFYTSSTIMPVPLVGMIHDVSAGGVMTNLPEHIYAEPHCAQQPLLRNEYASPADGNIESMDLYTEPIHDRDTNISVSQTAYALQRLPQYATPVRNQKLPSIPSTATAKNPNLPDVLYQSHKNPSKVSQQTTPSILNTHKPLTNVQRMAQDLQNTPKFHINPLTPHLNRQHLHLLSPSVYTTPDTSQKMPFTRSTEAQLALPEIDDCDLDMRGAAALPVDSGSNHSGGSNETVKIDDVIQYVDA